MTAKPIKQPGPDHPIAVAPYHGRVRILFAGQVVAESRRALALQEADYPTAFYLPRADARMQFLRRTDHTTYCPYKGDAAYFSIVADGRTAENAVWTYEAPHPAVAAIAGHLAFYPNRVDGIEAAPET